MFDRIIRRRPSTATIIASTALFASLGGVGYAAATIGSAEIRNNSVQGRDIRNGTIKSTDIARGTRNALKGNAGARGPAGSNGATGLAGANGTNGAKGDTGNTGASGLSRVIVRSRPDAFDPPNDPANVLTGASYILPAGGHVITVQAQVNPTAANWTVTCDLTVGGAPVDRITSSGAAALDRTQLAGHAVVATDTIALVALQCEDNGTGVILDDLDVSSLEVNTVD